MRLVTHRTLIQQVRQRFKEQYYNGESWAEICAFNPAEVYARLAELDLDTCTAAAVAKIIGNGTWTVIHCCECDAQCTEGIEFEDACCEPTFICANCLRNASALLLDGQSKHIRELEGRLDELEDRVEEFLKACDDEEAIDHGQVIKGLRAALPKG